jgi:hypothetical protein
VCVECCLRWRALTLRAASALGLDWVRATAWVAARAAIVNAGLAGDSNAQGAARREDEQCSGNTRRTSYRRERREGPRVHVPAISLSCSFFLLPGACAMATRAL